MPGRIPEALQQIFLASSKGEDVTKISAPANGVAFKTHRKGSGSKSSSKSSSSRRHNSSHENNEKETIMGSYNMPSKPTSSKSNSRRNENKKETVVCDDATASVTERTTDSRYDEDQSFLDEVQHPYATKDMKWTVSFDMKVSVLEIPSHTTFKEKIRKRCWYSKEEKDQMEDDAIKTAERFNKKITRKENKRKTNQVSEDPPAATACSEGVTRDALNRSNVKSINKLYRRYRGLETMTTRGDANIATKVSTIVNAILDEQEDQWKDYVINPHYDDDEALRSISSISRQLSIESTFDARLTALDDEREAIKIYSQGKFFDVTMKDCPSCAGEFLSMSMTGLQGQNSLYRAIARKKRSSTSRSRLSRSCSNITQHRGCDDVKTTSNNKRRSRSSKSSQKDLLARLKNHRSSSARDVYATSSNNDDTSHIQQNFLSRRPASTGDLLI